MLIYAPCDLKLPFSVQENAFGGLDFLLFCSIFISALGSVHNLLPGSGPKRKQYMLSKIF